jgi:uncharacterized protein YjbI with pentapeptide repeats
LQKFLTKRQEKDMTQKEREEKAKELVCMSHEGEFIVDFVKLFVSKLDEFEKDFSKLDLKELNVSFADTSKWQTDNRMELEMSDEDLNFIDKVSNYFSNCNFSDSDLRWSNFRGVNLENTNFSGANLEASNLADSYLKGANLEDSNLSVSNLKGVSLKDANLIGANLLNSRLDNVNFEGSKLDPETLKYIRARMITDTKDIKGIELRPKKVREQDCSFG